ncbi:FG-GAP-like repeat-containing protein [Spirosoma sordidisoli]|uniref:DUF1080 domain-containing protein n=1 Tax=Spirosoma sordidisoli TaxID=2502893 RepID=A0A4Q2UMM3_9BACT|nr:FG-GAP-like repeat-containing protein [Spirosoma sordidisoli]RYC68019.1 DUF1080 domain-containing protein [Spirosoma sordidisoli]
MRLFVSVFALMVLSASLFGQDMTASEKPAFGQTFVPDQVVRASDINSFQVVGQADWQAQNGEIVARLAPDSRGSWLVLNRSYQDVGLHALFKCSPSAETGVLLRMQKTDRGMKGIFLALNKDEVAPYAVSIDAQGKITEREKLRYAGGIYYRLAPPKNDAQANARRAMPPRPATPANLPLARPNTDFRADDWNMVETFIELNVIRNFLNDGAEIGGAVDGDSATYEYGPIALYAGGSGEVRFKDIMVKDIAMRVNPAEKSSPRFNVQCISDMYYSWGADAADFNKDGIMDVVAGPYIYYGPDYTKHREIFPAIAVSPSKEFTRTHVQFTHDFNGDGWPDVLISPSGASVLINPKGESRRWKSYDILPAVQSEITDLVDIDKDGQPELVYAASGSLRYAKPDGADPTKPWKEFIISDKGYALAHGIGTGDINGDGRLDILNAYGWWEQPDQKTPETLWAYHPYAFGRYGNRGSNIGGTLMAVFDANGDGLNDVITNLNVHGFGLAWFEQVRDKAGAISFTRHMISDDYSTKSAGNVTFSQPHGATYADVDGDGIRDFIVGKRYFTHLDNMYDPDSYGAPVLYWYRTVRNPKAPGGAEFVPELIHNRSGAGSEVTAVDINKDGAIDIVTSTNRGTFIFWNTPAGSKPKKQPSRSE